MLNPKTDKKTKHTLLYPQATYSLCWLVAKAEKEGKERTKSCHRRHPRRPTKTDMKVNLRYCPLQR